jgi:hypothetical protein
MTDTATLPPRNRIPPHLRPQRAQTMSPEQLRGAAEALVLGGGPKLKIERSDDLPRKPRPWYEIGRPIPNPGVVYFIDCDRYTKIGHAQNVDQRMAGIETANPFPLVLWAVVPGDFKLEREIHTKLAERRHRREWFILTEDDKAAIREAVIELGGRVLE